jgi:hypothetical protein
MGEVIHAAIEQEAARFEFRARLSAIVIAVFGVLGALAIAKTADEIDPSLAFFIAGVAMCVCSFTMIIGWGASRGHAELARLAASGHERMHEILAERLDGIEEIERQTGEAVVYALDDLREKRSQHGD